MVTFKHKGGVLALQKNYKEKDEKNEKSNCIIASSNHGI